MSRRATIFLLLSLAIGAFYARFIMAPQLEDPRGHELQRLQAEIDRLSLDSAADHVQINQLTAANRKLVERVVRYEIATSSLRRQSDSLIEEYRRLHVALQGESEGKKTMTRVPPPEDVAGSIKSVGQDRLITIDVGSDSGLNKGNTLDVYRLKPSLTFLGVIRILEVRPAQAVGKLVLRTGEIEVGDYVINDIVNLVK
ncbi:MAG: hypothetical protein K2R98_14450 [Gemmataceae bacterium]|nr:hypothetical protein [Gemmataceae bacterium]